ncbi:hypothetical protein HDG37_003880 [Paraburkholderia sp. MM5384-R2]|nr:hypothetical protein [Paraburkholderia sp. MM5384-R2]
MVRPQMFRTRITDLLGIRHPIPKRTLPAWRPVTVEADRQAQRCRYSSHVLIPAM